MGLKQYRSMRDFEKTPEPAGSGAARTAGSSPAYVVQKHAASHLHYDFRLELEGVLLSFAVPKGPSLDPEVKRLAMQTEDHPLEYGGFEGTIPKGEYGGGTVMLWDRGTWKPEGDAQRDYQRGRLTFTLHGERLRGRFHLVRTSRGEGRRSWLLFKGDDDEALAGDGAGVVERETLSVASGRSMDEIAAGAPPVRGPRRRKAPAKRPRSLSKPARSRTPSKMPRASSASAEIPLTNPDKVLWPEQGVTKRMLAEYYASVAKLMLPHVAGRPLTLVRCPEGRHKHCFFQKHATEGMPDAIRRIPIREKEGKASYTAIDDLEGLLSLVQLGVLEIHTWGAHADRPERPDLIVMDLDPDEALPFAEVVDTAVMLRGLLDEMGLSSFVKTTGGKGLHVCFPVDRRHEWDEVKDFTRGVAEVMASARPELYVTTASKQQRRGKIFIDYLRNARGATFIAPYSARARPGAPVALPVAWEALREGFDPQAFTLESVVGLLKRRRRDPWAGMAHLRQSITAVMKRRVRLR